MRKLILILCSFTLIFILSCKNSGGIKIGYLIPNSKSDRYQREQQFFKEKVAALGGEAVIASAEYDDKLQIQQAHDMVQAGAKVLVVNSVNMNTAAAIVRDAHDHGVKVIAYDRMIKNSDLDYYISFDNVKVGKLMAEYVIKVKPEGNYMLLGGDKADLNAVLVKKGQMEVLDGPIKAGKIKVLYNIFVEDWSEDNAYQETKSFLNLSEQTPDVILSSYDGMSTGAIKALAEHSMAGTVIVTGQDAELEACKNIMNGNQTMTIYKPLKTLADKSAEIAFKMATGEKFEIPTSTISNGQKEVPAILIDPIAVDKNNMESTIVKDGFHRLEELISK
jgi:D-xylose transport system substrate-binding protein